MYRNVIELPSGHVIVYLLYFDLVSTQQNYLLTRIPQCC